MLSGKEICRDEIDNSCLNTILLDRGMNRDECKATCTSPIIPLREKLFFRMIYETTTRPREVLEARIELWNRSTCEITFPKTKSKYNRWTKKFIPGSPKTMRLTQNTNEMLRHYIGNRKKGHIFMAAEKKETKADTLLMLADNATFFKSGDEPYAAIPVHGHIEIRPLSGRHFHWWLTRQFWNKTKRPADNETINIVKNTLQARAIFDGEEHTLHNRVAWYEGAIWYDLSNKEWEAVRITQEGWEIRKPPILFRRYQHQEPQVKPVKDGDIKLFLDFVNIKRDSDKLLVLVHLVSCLVPDIPHPILVPYGTQGAGKSGLVAAAKKIIDPSKMSLLSFPKDRTELVQQLDHNWFASYDNVDNIGPLISDELCKGVTGAGNSKRALFTDDEDVISVYRRCIAMNGINCAAVKPDILDRCLLIELERINPRNRKKEEELWAAFEAAKPVILGGVFKVLTKAMKIKPGVKLSILPRMADFTEWGYAIAEAMEYRGQDFLDAYYANIEEQNREAIMGNIIGEAILKFMEDRTEWVGTANGLLRELEMVADALKISTKSKGWPKGGNILTRRLNTLKVNLLEEGIAYETQKSGDRKIKIVRVKKEEKGGGAEDTENTAQTAQSSKPEMDAINELDDTEDDTLDNTIPSNISSSISPKEKQQQESWAGRLDDKDGISSTYEGEEQMAQRDKMNLIIKAIPTKDTVIIGRIQEETGLSKEYIITAITNLKNDGAIVEIREGAYRRVI